MSKLYIREPDDAARGRGLALTGGGLVLALVAGLVWLATDAPGTTPASAPARPQPVGQSPAATPAKAVPMALAASQVVKSPPGQVEACGIGILSDTAWNRSPRRDAFNAAVRASRLRTVTALKASADPLAQGLALAMESRGSEVAADEPVRCDGPDCPAASPKNESVAAAQRRVAANTAPRDVLARLALTSRSPELYGLAWRVCSTDGAQDAASACRMLSAEQWAQLDPDNAVPWASVLERARLRHDDDTAANALYRMSVSRTVDSRAGRLPGLALANVPAGTSALETEAVVADVAAREGDGWSVRLSAQSTEECTAAVVRDTNRWQRCDALAQALWQHGRKTLDLLTAARIGKAVGWGPERLQPMEDEAAALSFVSTETLGSALSCDAVRRRISHFDESGRLGEVALARRMIAASGKPMAHWAAAAQANRRAVARADLPASSVAAGVRVGAATAP